PRIKRVKEVFALPGGWPFAAVLDDKVEPLWPWRFEPHAGPSFRGCSLNRVSQQTSQSESHLVRIDACENGLFGTPAYQPYFSLRRKIAQSGDDFVDEAANVHRLLLRLGRPGKVHKFAQDFMDALGLLDDRLQGTLRGRIGGWGARVKGLGVGRVGCGG